MGNNIKEIENLLHEYIIRWENIEGVKPCNEPEFCELFLRYIDKNNYDDIDFEFQNDGSYFGKQFYIGGPLYSYSNPPLVSLEVCFNKNKISIYKANHHGFWTAEFICIESDSPLFFRLDSAIKSLLIHFLGIGHWFNNEYKN